MSQETREAIRAFIAEDLMIGESVPIGDDDELLADGIIDSIGVVRLVGFIENELGVVVPPEDVIVENFRTIGALAGHIEAAKGVGR